RQKRGIAARFARPVRSDQRSEAMALRRRRTDVRAVETERFGELARDGGVHALAGDAADYLADEPSISERVIAAAPGVLRRLGASERAGHVLPIEHALGVIDETADPVEPRLVTEDLSERDALFSRLRELRPVFGHGIVVIDEASIDERVHEGGDHPFR